MSILTQEFVFAAVEAEVQGNQFPINLGEEKVWRALGYNKLDAAEQRLESYQWFKYARDYVCANPTSRKNTYLLSVDAYKTLALIADTEKGDETRQYFIEVEKNYRAQLQRQFASSPDTSEVDALKLENAQLKESLAQFTDQLSAEFDCDLDTIHHLSGLKVNRQYVVNALTHNFIAGKDFIVVPDLFPHKGNLPKFKYYTTQLTENALLASFRSFAGVPLVSLPGYMVIERDKFFQVSTGKKNKLFPNGR